MSWRQDFTFGHVRYKRDEDGELQPIGLSRCHPALGRWPDEDRTRSVAVIVSSDFPDEEIVRSVLARGAEKEPESTVFVVRGKPNSKDAARWAVEALRAAGREPILAESNRAYWGNQAGNWRDGEMMTLCDLILVFHDKKSATTSKFIKDAPHVHVIERGVERKKYQRRSRKPIGA